MIPTIQGIKLPTTRQVLQLFFYKHNELKHPIRKSSREAVDEVEKKWRQAGIPVGSSQYSISKLEKLHSKWVNVKKSINKKQSEVHRKNEENFTNELDKLFDIAQRDVMTIITEDQKLFLSAQRDPTRRGFLPRSTSPLVASENSEGSFSGYREVEDENTNDTWSAETTNSTFDQSTENIDDNTVEIGGEDIGIYP